MRISDWSSDVCSSDLGNDVDLFALQFLNHRLNAATLHADAGTDRVDRTVAADHADLRARTGVAGSGLDLDNAIVAFRHFLREQLLHEFGMRTAEQDLRTTVVAFDLGNERRPALAGAC